MRRYIAGHNSEIYFARCAVFVEGESEAQALPLFASALGIDLDRLGISLVAANSHNFSAFFRICAERAFDISWVVLCDGDAARKVGNQLLQAGLVEERQLKLALSSDTLVDDVLEPSACFSLSPESEALSFESLMIHEGMVPPTSRR